MYDDNIKKKDGPWNTDCIDVFYIVDFITLEGNGNHIIKIYLANQKKPTLVNNACIAGVHLLVCYVNLNIP